MSQAGAATLIEAAAGHAAARPEHPAVICQDRRVSYGQLHRHSSRVAYGIGAAGLRPGSRVAFLGRESERYYEIFLGCVKAGAVLVPINWRLTAAEVDHILRDSEAELLFVDGDLRELVARLEPDLPALRESVPLTGEGYLRWRDAQPVSERWPMTGPEDPVIQLYTSGTTGLPKGVVLAQRSFFAIRDALAREGLDWIDWRPDDVSLIGIPGFHVGGIWWATQGFVAGVTNVALPVFDSAEVLRRVRELGVTTMCVVPAMLRLILQEPEAGPADLRSLRKVVYGGSPIAESLLAHATERLGAQFAQIYGLTETGNTAVCLPPADHRLGRARLRAAGRPYPGVSVKIVDRAGGELPTGEVGEVCLRTPARMLEYWRLPEATAATLVDGWIHTGDAGYLDPEGYLYIQDRIKDMIIVAGEKIYPAEVENALVAHPGVAEAAVVGVPDERFGEAVHAYVACVPGQEVSSRELLTFLRDRLAPFKIPSRFEFLDQVPRNPSGKILRRELRDRYWSDHDRRIN